MHLLAMIMFRHSFENIKRRAGNYEEKPELC